MKKHSYIDFDRWVWISLTQKCNWRCWYCDHPKISNPQTVSLDYFNEFCEQFLAAKGKSNIEVSLEGGEIGLLSEDYLDVVFASGLSDTYTITTNGLFMKKDYHTKYKDKIHHILYHVTPEMNETLTFPRYDFDPSIQVLYTMVVHKNNIKFLDDFLTYNKDVIFLPHYLQPRTDNLNFMNKNDFQQIYDIMKDKPNIEDHMKLRLLDIIHSFDNIVSLNTFRRVCCNFYNKIIFNLPRKIVHRCCISMNTSSIPITSTSIHDVLYNKLYTFPYTDPTCTECIANFVWLQKSHYTNPRTELNNRKIYFNILRRAK